MLHVATRPRVKEDNSYQTLVSSPHSTENSPSHRKSVSKVDIAGSYGWPMEEAIYHTDPSAPYSVPPINHTDPSPSESMPPLPGANLHPCLAIPPLKNGSVHASVPWPPQINQCKTCIVHRLFSLPKDGIPLILLANQKNFQTRYYCGSPQRVMCPGDSSWGKTKTTAQHYMFLLTF
jgi:hypothetical protein